MDRREGLIQLMLELQERRARVLAHIETAETKDDVTRLERLGEQIANRHGRLHDALIELDRSRT